MCVVTCGLGFLMPSPVSCCDASRAKSAREASQGKNSTNISINHYTLPGERRSERTVTGCCRLLLQAAAGCCRLLIRVQRLLALAAHAAGPAAASSSRYELLMDLLLCLLRPRRWPSALERQSRGLRKSLEADFSSVFGSNSGSMMKYTSTSLNSASSHSEVKASN